MKAKRQPKKETCPKCGSTQLKGIWDNTGWDGYEGARHDEQVGTKCLDCGHENYD